MREILIGLVAGAVATIYAVPQAAAQNWQICAGINGSYTPQQEIAACTDIIRSPATKSSDLDQYYNNRAVAYLLLDQYDDAVKDFSQAIAYHPRDSYYNNRAEAYHLDGEDAKGLLDADKATAAMPNNPDFLDTRAAIYEKLGRHDEAIADYRASLKLDPNDVLSKQGLKRLGASP